MSDYDLADLLGTRETPALEFERIAKREGRRGDAIAKAVCAMANDLPGRGGGDILIGVEDDGTPAEGVDTGDEALLALTNPGGPFGQVRGDNFDRVNDYRNPSLAAAMKGLGYVNRFGRGIGRIQAALERNGNPPAEFQVDDSSWAVVLRQAAV